MNTQSQTENYIYTVTEVLDDGSVIPWVVSFNSLDQVRKDILEDILVLIKEIEDCDEELELDRQEIFEAVDKFFYETVSNEFQSEAKSSVTYTDHDMFARDLIITRTELQS